MSLTNNLNINVFLATPIWTEITPFLVEKLSDTPRLVECSINPTPICINRFTLVLTLSNTLIFFLPHLKTLLKWCTIVGLKSKPLLSCPKIPVCHSTNPVPKDSNTIAQPCFWACLHEKYIIFSFGGMYYCKDTTKSAPNSPECGILLLSWQLFLSGWAY